MLKWKWWNLIEIYFVSTVSDVNEAFSAMEPNAFEAKYGFARPEKDIGRKLVVSCRSGRRVKLAIEELSSLGYSGLTWGSF